MYSKLLLVSGFILFSPLYAAFASSFSQLTVFGDSLSDNGNAFLLTGGSTPGANYGTYTFPDANLTTAHFSDGPNTTPVAAGPAGLWVDQLASKLGVADPVPVAAGGANASNYAVGGAETATGLQSIGNQVTLFSTTHLGNASPTGLYAFWGGANDLFAGASPIAAADNIESYISTLHGEGADNFLWLNLPLLGQTPEGKVDSAALNATSVAFNDEWARDLAALEGSGIHVDGVNIGTLFSNIIASPGSYGLTNVTQPAQGLNIPTDAGYLFWDSLHPTTAGHALVADAAFAALTATPEPASVGFALFGLLALAGFGIRRYGLPNQSSKVEMETIFCSEE
jgi:phospholipase/lecithinase/hemolysin